MKNIRGFSVIMENVSTRQIYVIFVMTVETTATSRRQMELFVVGVLNYVLGILRR